MPDMLVRLYELPEFIDPCKDLDKGIDRKSVV